MDRHILAQIRALPYGSVHSMDDYGMIKALRHCSHLIIAVFRWQRETSPKGFPIHASGS